MADTRAQRLEMEYAAAEQGVDDAIRDLNKARELHNERMACGATTDTPQLLESRRALRDAFAYRDATGRQLAKARKRELFRGIRQVIIEPRRV